MHQRNRLDQEEVARCWSLVRSFGIVAIKLKVTPIPSNLLLLTSMKCSIIAEDSRSRQHERRNRLRNLLLPTFRSSSSTVTGFEGSSAPSAFDRILHIYWSLFKSPIGIFHFGIFDCLFTAPSLLSTASSLLYLEVKWIRIVICSY